MSAMRMTCPSSEAPVLGSAGVRPDVRSGESRGRLRMAARGANRLIGCRGPTLRSGSCAQSWPLQRAGRHGRFRACSEIRLAGKGPDPAGSRDVRCRDTDMVAGHGAVETELVIEISNGPLDNIVHTVRSELPLGRKPAEFASRRRSRPLRNRIRRPVPRAS